MCSTAILFSDKFLRSRKIFTVVRSSGNSYYTWRIFKGSQSLGIIRFRKTFLTNESRQFECFRKYRNFMTNSLAPKPPTYNTFFSFPFTRRHKTDLLHVSYHLLYKRPISNMAADGIKLCWNVKKENIENDAEKLMERMKKVYDAIGILSDDQVTYENVVQVRYFNLYMRTYFSKKFA